MLGNFPVEPGAESKKMPNRRALEHSAEHQDPKAQSLESSLVLSPAKNIDTHTHTHTLSLHFDVLCKSRKLESVGREVYLF